MGAHSTDSDTAVRTRTKKRVEPPQRYSVLLHNDDYTTQDFVVDVLMSVFRKSEMESVRIMLAVHQRGVGIAGVYTKSVAETKIATVHRMAREAGFPLRCSMEPV